MKRLEAGKDRGYAGAFRRLVALSGLLALTSLLFAGCASLPKEVQRTSSVDRKSTRLNSSH